MRSKQHPTQSNLTTTKSSSPCPCPSYGKLIPDAMPSIRGKCHDGPHAIPLGRSGEETRQAFSTCFFAVATFSPYLRMRLPPPPHRSTITTSVPSCCALRRPEACYVEASWPLSKVINSSKNHPTTCPSCLSLFRLM